MFAVVCTEKRLHQFELITFLLAKVIKKGHRILLFTKFIVVRMRQTYTCLNSNSLLTRVFLNHLYQFLSFTFVDIIQIKKKCICSTCRACDTVEPHFKIVLIYSDILRMSEFSLNPSLSVFYHSLFQVFKKYQKNDITKCQMISNVHAQMYHFRIFIKIKKKNELFSLCSRIDFPI